MKLSVLPAIFQACCGDGTSPARPAFPFRKGNYIYATDQRILVRAQHPTAAVLEQEYTPPADRISLDPGDYESSGIPLPDPLLLFEEEPDEIDDDEDDEDGGFGLCLVSESFPVFRGIHIGTNYIALLRSHGIFGVHPALRTPEKSPLLFHTKGRIGDTEYLISRRGNALHPAGHESGRKTVYSNETEAMICPKCNRSSEDAHGTTLASDDVGVRQRTVIDKRHRKDGTIRRRRSCRFCGFRFTTVERIAVDLIEKDDSPEYSI